MNGKLNVRTTRFNSNLANHRKTCVTHSLVFFVRQCLSGGDGDRVAGVDAHWIKVLNRADNDNVVIQVTHHFHLVLLPADDGLFNQNFGCG